MTDHKTYIFSAADADDAVATGERLTMEEAFQLIAHFNARNFCQKHEAFDMLQVEGGQVVLVIVKDQAGDGDWPMFVYKGSMRPINFQEKMN